MNSPFHIGIDICSVHRMQKAVERSGDRFLNRIFTENEQAYCRRKRNQYENYAARFAAKEAVIKAKKGGKGRFAFNQIEVTRGLRGAPTIHLSKRARKTLAISPTAQFELTLTHEREFAVAAVVMFDA
jgi:holo-[acyl-carrier protein] synthase